MKKEEPILTNQLGSCMKNTYKIIWSDEALNNLKGILDYLESRWTKRELRQFAQLLEKHLHTVEHNPFLFAESGESNGMRKSVMTKQTTIYYRIVNFK